MDTTDTGPAAPVDATQAALFALQVWTYRQGALVSTMIHLGAFSYKHLTLPTYHSV